MCTAVLAPPGKQVTYDHVKTCFDNNSDGAGYAFNTDGVVVLHKAFFDLDKFWKHYWLDSRRFKGSTFMLHFRIATSGHKDAVNAHPFRINPNLVFSHNGVISNLTYSDKTKSDTYALMTILKDLPPDFYKNQNILTLLSLGIGWSKLVFLDGEGKYSFVNEDKGFWNEGIWYSNENYKPKKDYGHWDLTKRMWVDTKGEPFYGYDKPGYSYNKDTKTADTKTDKTTEAIVQATFNGFTRTKDGIWVRTRETSVVGTAALCRICKAELLKGEKNICAFCDKHDVCALCGTVLMPKEVNSGICGFCEDGRYAD
jgi:hypothetical protein